MREKKHFHINGFRLTQFRNALLQNQEVVQVSSDRDDRMGTKIKTQKNPQGFQQNPKNSLDQTLTPKRSHAEFLSHIKFIHRTRWLGYVGTIMHLQILLNTPKNALLNQATQKILAKIFQPQKIPKSKISNPKKPSDHPYHLKSTVPPWVSDNPGEQGKALAAYLPLVSFITLVSSNSDKNIRWTISLQLPYPVF